MVPPTKFMSNVCQRVPTEAHCVMPLMANPSAYAANGSIPLAKVVIGDGITHAEKTVALIDEVVDRDPSRKSVFKECREAYVSIGINFRNASNELISNPHMANHNIMISYDQKSRVDDLVVKNSDWDSKTLWVMNDQMYRSITIAVGATEAVLNDSNNTFRRA